MALVGACPEIESESPDFSFLPELFSAKAKGAATLPLAGAFAAGALAATTGLAGTFTGVLATGFFAGAFFVYALGADFLERGAFFATGFLAGAGAFLAGTGFLAGFFADLTALEGAFFRGALATFLAKGAFLTGFPEGFRDGEDLEFFFNGSRVMPKSRARKDR